MNGEVSEEVLRKTKQCLNNFSCLRTGKGKCTVNAAVGKDMLFLSYKSICNCPYRLSFGERQLCAFPTYYALYKK